MIYLAHIRTDFAMSNGTYGSPRMHRDLIYDGHRIGRHRTSRLMRENGLVARQKRRFKRTTDSEHAWPVAANRLGQDFEAEQPGASGGPTSPTSGRRRAGSTLRSCSTSTRGGSLDEQRVTD